MSVARTILHDQAERQQREAVAKMFAALDEIVRFNDECADDYDIGFNPGCDMMRAAREAVELARAAGITGKI